MTRYLRIFFLNVSKLFYQMRFSLCLLLIVAVVIAQPTPKPSPKPAPAANPQYFTFRDVIDAVSFFELNFDHLNDLNCFLESFDVILWLIY